MTKEEAKYYFQQLMNRMDGINLYKPEGGIALGAKEQLFGVIDMALEKQIPKKIDKTAHGYECPSCKAFWATFKGNFIDTNFCPNCGQRIDWGDE